MRKGCSVTYAHAHVDNMDIISVDTCFSAIAPIGPNTYTHEYTRAQYMACRQMTYVADNLLNLLDNELVLQNHNREL